ncbi:phage tail protein [Emticicia sp. 21SJ11W-3]|uniref:phage tail protein n=1 Tax=Emticicia sp. 21SJ11W-3 TaxID=2916755 RepID=UPI0020A08F45|nr:tail fiber protein [Emticicia sp. 21SJ11W-3]UTA68945.1 tail fiber protein [Emticicia sp. 21SJ11W-3]
MDEYLGVIKPFAGVTFVPVGWHLCDGTQLPISGNEALFAIIGYTYGGDGKTKFALPNLQGRAVVGPGQGQGLTNRTLGQIGGAENVAITESTFPAHTHTSFALNVDADSSNPSDLFLTKTLVDRYCIQEGSDMEVKMGNDIISTAPGGNLPHNNMPPFMAINYIICVQGIYPERP